MIRHRLLPTLSLVLLISVTGCQDNVPGASGFTVRDSAGVEIVESSSPLLGPDAWTISEEPVLQIGEGEGEDPYLLLKIPFSRGTGMSGVFRTDDERIVIVNGGDRSVRFFDQTGKFLSQFGRDGNGPGEFRSTPRACIPFGEGFAVVERNRVSFFDDQGQFLDRFDLTISRGLGVHGVFPDRSLLVQASDPSASLDRRPDFHLHISTGIVKIQGSDGSVSEWTLSINSGATFQGWEGNALRTRPAPFAPSLLLFSVGEEFVYGWGDSYNLQFFNRDGEMTRMIRRHSPPTPLTDEDRDAWANSQELLPDSYSAFENVLLDLRGHVWVQRLHPKTAWDVFDPSGRWITTVRFPNDVQIHDIGEDYILGVWKDDLDVEYVRMYSLDRGG